MKIADLHPTRIIGRLRAVPRWKIGAAACALSVVGGSMGVGLTWYTTNTKQFCLSCHRYQRIAFGDQPMFHPGSVVCADCHGEGHSILPRRFAADPGVVRVRCQHCHQQIITDEQSNFKYNVKHIRMTHASHLKRPGVTCATCHYNVAHDRREHPTHRPPMEACFQCHKSEKRACNTCHPAGSLPIPVAQSQIDPETCDECHLNWEAWTYEVRGQAFQHGPHLSGGLRCEECHSHKGRHGDLSFPDGNCWQVCHRIRPASHGGDWRERHGGEAEAKARNCGQCHQPRFCADCHGLEMPHPQGWRAEHARRAGQVTCARCHGHDFCEACHRSTKPATHAADWLHQHQLAQTGQCAQCHTKAFCTACHERIRPASHDNNWLSRHSGSAKAKREVCATCHSREFCLGCHGGVDLPHPSDWVMKHKGQASFAAGSVCFRCHKYKETCASCHGEEPPK